MARIQSGYDAIQLHAQAAGPDLNKVKAALGGRDARRLADGELLPLIFRRWISREPGPRACGAVVVQVGATPADCSMKWLDSISLANLRTTNNQAENHGLLYGLRACARNRWQRLHIIGDSYMIIRQHATRRALIAPLRGARTGGFVAWLKHTTEALTAKLLTPSRTLLWILSGAFRWTWKMKELTIYGDGKQVLS
ncbi:Ribonuclease H-like domain [Phytophthora cactorum]|nr:Ribonuclease H-like domain [Phytophthora cactorum]